MSNYADIARQNWQTLAPSAYAKMQQEMNLEEHFQQIQEQAELMVQGLMFQYAGADSPNEGYLQKVGRLQAAKKRAEETVNQELLTPPQELWEEEVETMSDWEIQSEMLWIEQTLGEIRLNSRHRYIQDPDHPQEHEILLANRDYEEEVASILKRQRELQQMLDGLGR